MECNAVTFANPAFFPNQHHWLGCPRCLPSVVPSLLVIHPLYTLCWWPAWAQAFELALTVHEAVRNLAYEPISLPPAIMLHACCCSPPQPAPVYTVRQVVEYAPVTFDLVATMDSILQERVAREVSTSTELPPSADAAWPCWSEAFCTLSTADHNQSKKCVGA